MGGQGFKPINDQTNIKAWFKVVRIWHLNPKAMDKKLNHQALTHQELQIVKVKMKMITHQMAKLVQASNGWNKL